MAKQAVPAHYSVDKTGGPDPTPSHYFVLNVSQDPIAREALAYLGNKYERAGRQQLAQEAFSLLDETREAFAKVMAGRQPKKKK
ncbi:MAG: hypothetical protein HOV97_05255 [Nonomuraea sp.]|nr:hypothetical protein [Nonomuraea sp.]